MPNMPDEEMSSRTQTPSNLRRSNSVIPADFERKFQSHRKSVDSLHQNPHQAVAEINMSIRDTLDHAKHEISQMQ